MITDAICTVERLEPGDHLTFVEADAIHAHTFILGGRDEANAQIRVAAGAVGKYDWVESLSFEWLQMMLDCPATTVTRNGVVIHGGGIES